MKRNNLIYPFALLVAALLPSTALADFSFIWSPPAGDKSIEFLGLIFGNVGTTLTGTGTLIGNLFYIFNIAVLSLGSIVVSYTIILSTMNTAQEGEVMGRKWSSIWIPLRCAVGMAFLLPTASGYSLIQVLMMQFVVYGVGAADQIWTVAVNNMGTSGGITGAVKISNAQLEQTAQGLFDGMVCAQVLNNNPTCQIAIGNRTVGPYIDINNQVLIGIPGDPNLKNVCGTFRAAPAPYGVDATAWQSANVAALQTAAYNLNIPAAQVYSIADPTAWSGQNVIDSAANTLKQTLSSAAATNAPPDDAESADKANNGWLYAGSYYFEMNKGGTQTATYGAPSSTGGGGSTTLGNDCNAQLSTYQGRSAEYLNQTTVAAPASNSSQKLQLQPANISQPQALAFYNSITSPVRSLTYDLLDYLTTNDVDPVSSLRQVGSDIMTTAENIWFSIMALGFIILIGTCVMSGMQPMCWAIGAIISVLIPVLSLILMLLWAAGVAIGLYLPLVPYLVFTFTALGWFILVIEAMAAAPVVALGLVSPAAEELGKAAPAVMIITNIFLRPSLMVIGFVIAAKLVQASIMMVNYGFESTVKASTGGLGLFGCIALICLYGGLVITIIHECFSLIYVLPDKIIRWIGGPAEQSTVKGSVQEVKGASEKGAEIGSSMMKGSAALMEEKVAEKLKSGGKGGGGGGGAPPPPTGLTT